MSAYVDFGYGNDEQITRDGELLATLGFPLEQVADSHDNAVMKAFEAAGGDMSPHSGYSWSCACSVAAVLQKHGWTTVDNVPEDSPLYERVVK